MPEIGATLREARMRQRIDISEIESRTKIRAKYLRALENEEWDLLPGPTFVKSFLRTYAEALELDARLLLEEYKLRHERLTEHDLMPIAPPGRRESPRRGPPPGIGRDVLVAVAVVAIVGLLILLGSGSDDDPERASTTTQTTERPARTTETTPREEEKKKKPAEARFARLQLLPVGDVWLCVEAAGNRRLVNGQVVDETTELPSWRSSEFVMTFGNGSVRMRINGKTLDVPEVQEPVGYRVDRAGKRTELSEAERPTCA